MDVIDEIRLTGLRVFGRHGVYDHERRDGQDFVVDLTLMLDIGRAAQTDDVADTVHYGVVAEQVAAIVGGEPVNLLETLATRIADRLLADYAVRIVRVTVHKPSAPIPLSFDDVSVTVTRSRDAR
ncbi:dihydroneopterin aldolase [Microbacterium rhizomatis]|uniref:7,8-dihydroneopterin aldolase n=1 Tax=Microbacterium rhizomatis TaxID=1631477 RepID=A0A5J5IYI8_9MICO|nr:dihydroneopterin aldolase [Microbacterium rhizomatis]KAA9106516.1 dihydroneopterin aldolase [Microbacterium rhizomatis]